jgi:hypothetical protein
MIEKLRKIFTSCNDDVDIPEQATSGGARRQAISQPLAIGTRGTGSIRSGCFTRGDGGRTDAGTRVDLRLDPS